MPLGHGLGENSLGPVLPKSRVVNPAAMVLVLNHATLSLLTAWLIVVAFFSSGVHGAAVDTTRWIQYTGNDGTVWLDDDRRPSLYTQNYGDCMGDSLINVTRFDAAYYKDNMTVLFHLEGNSALTNESLMCKLMCSPN